MPCERSPKLLRGPDVGVVAFLGVGEALCGSLLETDIDPSRGVEINALYATICYHAILCVI